MTAIYLRLSAPLQSWATHRVTGNIVNTQPHPTRSGLTGLMACCLGFCRGAWEPWLDDVEYRVRVDRPGRIVDDFQTINPHDQDRARYAEMFLRATLSKSKKLSATPDGASNTSIVRRTYLADAEFIVEIRVPENRVSSLIAALKDPYFVPYLGRKAFAPAFPFFLGTGPHDALATLPAREPAAQQAKRDRAERNNRYQERRAQQTGGARLTQAADGEPAQVLPGAEHPLEQRKYVLLGATSNETLEAVTVPVVPASLWLTDVAKRFRR